MLHRAAIIGVAEPSIGPFVTVLTAKMGLG